MKHNIQTTQKYLLMTWSLDQLFNNIQKHQGILQVPQNAPIVTSAIHF